MALWAQPEDKMLQDVGNVILKKPVRYKDFWRDKATPGKGVQSSRNVGPSANWYQLAAGLSIWSHYDPAIVGLSMVLSEPNDFLQGEFMADAAHSAFSLVGMMFQRRYLGIGSQLTEQVDREILQFWAQLFLCSTANVNPQRPIFGWAHQRSVYPTGFATGLDYYWRRGMGQSHSGTGLASMAERYGDFQAPFNLKLFADAFIAELKKDISRVVGAYDRGGFKEVASLIKRGSRGVWHWVRTNEGGYISLVEGDVGVDEPRYVAMRSTPGSTLVQFPWGKLPRVNRNGRAGIDMKNGVVDAEDSSYGKFVKTFDPQSVNLHYIANPNGVYNAMTGASNTFTPFLNIDRPLRELDRGTIEI